MEPPAWDGPLLAGFAGWEGVRLSLDRDGRAILRGLVAPPRLAHFAGMAAAAWAQVREGQAGPAPAGRLSGAQFGQVHPGCALHDLLPAPQAYQLIQHLLGPAYGTGTAVLLSGAATAADLEPDISREEVLFWLPLQDGADAGEAALRAGDVLLLRAAAASLRPPCGPAVLLGFAAAPASPRSVPVAGQAMRQGLAQAAAAARHLLAEGGPEPGVAVPASSDIVVALARIMQDASPEQVLPPLRAALEDLGLVPPGTPAWAMPEAETLPDPVPLPPPPQADFGLCMSVRNHAALLGRALDGLAAQRRRFDRIVLVNDASDDATPQLLEDFAARRPEVEVLHNRERLGAVASTARAMARLETGYVAWAAADDLLLPVAVERLASAAAAQPSAGILLGETGVVSYEAGRFGERGTMKHGGSRLASLPPFLAPQSMARALSCRRLSFGTAWAVRRDVLQAGGGFEPELGAQSDFFALLQILCRHGAAIVPEQLAVMTLDRDSFSHRAARSADAALRTRDACMNRLKSPALRDVYFRLAAVPALVIELQSATEMFTGYFAFRPQHWDLMVRALRWALRHGEMSVGPAR